MYEYLSLYAERDGGQEAYFVKNFPEKGNRQYEPQLLNQLGADGWELVAVAPAYVNSSIHVNHQLYLRRLLRQYGEATTRLSQ